MLSTNVREITRDSKLRSVFQVLFCSIGGAMSAATSFWICCIHHDTIYNLPKVKINSIIFKLYLYRTPENTINA